MNCQMWQACTIILFISVAGSMRDARILARAEQASGGGRSLILVRSHGHRSARHAALDTRRFWRPDRGKSPLRTRLE